MKITRRIFESQRQRQFGTANPERMQIAFWEWMIRRSEEDRLRDCSDERDPSEIGNSPYELRQHFGVDLDCSQGPVWNFDRMGATRTPHPDGRVICIGGEHEDYYDPDFCIYNDVVVLDLDGSVEIYGYSLEAFPPTDFHTATLVGDRVIVIGRLGYKDERRSGATPVMVLDLATYRFEECPSHGELPGWIFGHDAELSGGTITIRGGEVHEENDGEDTIRRNFDDFAYDIATGGWKRLTTRNWRQFSISDAGGKSFFPGPKFRGCCPSGDESWKCEPVEREGETPEGLENDDVFVYVLREYLFPRDFEYETVSCDEYSPEERIYVAGVPVSIKMESFSIEVVIEGEMDGAMATALVEDVKASVEADTGRPCVVKAYS